MTHFYVESGTVGGGVAPRTLVLQFVNNQNSIANKTLEYVNRRQLTLTRITNSQTFGSPTLTNVVVSTLTQTRVTNNNSIGSLSLANLPFVPDNTETTDLINAFTGSYPTTVKIQIDTLITNLKNAGIWSKLDWYGNAYWAVNEHDALINWVNVSQTLTKVGSASWSQGAGLIGVNPATSNSRYKSGWNIGNGPHSSGTNFAMFCKITDISVPQNQMQPMGVWQYVSGGGPVTPDGAFFQISVLNNTGFAGGYLQNGNGNTSLTPGDGKGVWGISHNGSSQITVKDGSTQETDSVSGSSSYTDSDGVSVAGSAGGSKRSFPGTTLYWGWGSAMSAADFGNIESSFQDAILPPSALDNALLINANEDFLTVDGSEQLKVDG